jgi:hypothetical protein
MPSYLENRFLCFAGGAGGMEKCVQDREYSLVDAVAIEHIESTLGAMIRTKEPAQLDIIQSCFRDDSLVI